MLETSRDAGYRRVESTARLQIEKLRARLQCHHNFFKTAVTGALTDAIDGAFDLPRTGSHRGQAIRNRHPQIVVAMHA